MNIDDPIGVAALLEQLKSSPAWQELEAARNAESSAMSHPSVPQAQEGEPIMPGNLGVIGPANVGSQASVNSLPVPSISGSSVASLLSQLESFSTVSVEPYPAAAPNYHGYNYDTGAPVPSAMSNVHSNAPPAPEDRRNLTFRQSLPIISELVDDPPFVASVKEMKKNQDVLERRLHQEREHIYSKYQEKIKVAQTKAKMIGSSVSQHEINMITDAFKKEISKFDLERVLPAWDGLISRQQQELAQLSVPTMFLTSDPDDRKRQQQVVELLFSLLGHTAT